MSKLFIHKRAAEADIAVASGALEDGDFSGGADPVRYSIDLGGAPGPFTVEAELCYQPIGYRWAMNLKHYDADESRRFTGHYEAVSTSSMVVLAHAHAE